MRFLSVYALFIILNACNSPQVTPESGPTKIILKDHRTGTTIGVYNESFVSKTDYYSQSRSSADFKVIPNEHMGALLQQLERSNYFEKAENGIRRTPGARTTLIVDRNGNSWNLAWTPTDAEQKIALAQECNAAFFAIYNANFSYQIIDNSSGKNIFEDEEVRLRSREK